MTINRAAFFAAVRASFSALKQGQVDGFNAVLDAWEAGGGGDDRHFAYMLATAWHETAFTMRPIKEMGGGAYFKKMYDIEGSRPNKARELGNLSPGDGARYCGRGYVQLTGKYNYRKAGAEVSADLVSDPDLALYAPVAAAIMFAGMQGGWFTGRKLSDYEGGGNEFDPVSARRIINGTDKAQSIAGHYRKFMAVLLASHVAAPAPIRPPPPDIPPPATPTKPASSGFFVAILTSVLKALKK